MPTDEPNLSQDSTILRESIKRLCEQSDRLRVAAKLNAKEAEAIAQRISAVQREPTGAEKRRQKTTSGRIA